MSTTQKKHSGAREIASAAVGSALEWYDFSVYAFFAIYIAQNFFKQGDPNAQLVEAFMAFGLGFVVRPLGAMIIGAYGDRKGRKAALNLTIISMTVGTAFIAFAPTYLAIGFGATILIVCGRVLQGFSAGGEIGGAAAFLIEHAPENKKGMYSSWLQASMAISNVLGALVATVVTLVFTADQIGDWGWRIPFILGLSVAPLGMWMRMTMNETPDFEKELAQRKQQQEEDKKSPLIQVFKDYPASILSGAAFSILWAAAPYTLIVYMPTYLQKIFHFHPEQAFTASLIGNILMVVTCLFSGHLSDKIGKYKILVSSAILMAITIYPVLLVVDMVRTTAILIIAQTYFCILVAFFAGVAPVALSEFFPTKVRASGMSISYNIAVMTFGGFGPMILTLIHHHTGTHFAPAWYIMGASALTLVAIAYVKRKNINLTSINTLQEQEL